LWAVFRHKLTLQLQEQLSDVEDSKRTPGWPKLGICQMSFIDEHHEKCRIGKGGTSKHEWIAGVDVDDPNKFVPLCIDGDPDRPNPRARLLDCEARPKAKFEAKRRGLFGACMLPKEQRDVQMSPDVTDKDAAFYTADRTRPFNCAGCKAAGGKAWSTECKSKFLCVTELPTFGESGVWKTGGDTIWENSPFKNRCPGTWEKELRKTTRSSKIMWANDLAAHTVAEGNRTHEGTKWADTWVMHSTML
jgi:hypothetical protein